MKRPIMPDTTGKAPRWIERETKTFQGKMKKYNAPINREINAAFKAKDFIRFDIAKAVESDDYDAAAKRSLSAFNKYHGIVKVIPEGYVKAIEFITALGYSAKYMSPLFDRANVGDRFRTKGAVYLSPKQQDILTAYRIEAEKFSFSDMVKGTIEASKRGRAIGLQAQRFGENGITGNYFSDYVTEHFGSAQYERYVNGNERIDAFTVVDGVAHIIEFKTGNVHPMNHKEQVLRYAKGLRDEGYSNIKVSILYYDNRDQNVSWNVDVDVLDDEYRKVVDYIASIPSRVRGTV